MKELRVRKFQLLRTFIDWREKLMTFVGKTLLHKEGKATAHGSEADAFCFGKQPVSHITICDILFSKPAFQMTPLGYFNFHQQPIQCFPIHWRDLRE